MEFETDSDFSGSSSLKDTSETSHKILPVKHDDQMRQTDPDSMFVESVRQQ